MTRQLARAAHAEVEADAVSRPARIVEEEYLMRQEHPNSWNYGPRLVLPLGRHANAAMRHQRSGEGRPSGLMRGAKALARLAVEVLMETKRIPPQGVFLETGFGAMRRAPAVRVEQK